MLTPNLQVTIGRSNMYNPSTIIEGHDRVGNDVVGSTQIGGIARGNHTVKEALVPQTNQIIPVERTQRRHTIAEQTPNQRLGHDQAIALIRNFDVARPMLHSQRHIRR